MGKNTISRQDERGEWVPIWQPLTLDNHARDRSLRSYGFPIDSHPISGEGYFKVDADETMSYAFAGWLDCYPADYFVHLTPADVVEGASWITLEISGQVVNVSAEPASPT